MILGNSLERLELKMKANWEITLAGRCLSSWAAKAMPEVPGDLCLILWSFLVVMGGMLMLEWRSG